MPSVYVSLYPLDARFTLLTNLLWCRDDSGNPTLSKEHMWVQFPQKLRITGIEIAAAQPLGGIVIETSEDYKNSWTLVKEAGLSASEAGKPTLTEWEPLMADNLRIVADPTDAAGFPLVHYFRSVRLRCEETAAADSAAGDPNSANPPAGESGGAATNAAGLDDGCSDGGISDKGESDGAGANAAKRYEGGSDPLYSPTGSGSEKPRPFLPLTPRGVNPLQPFAGSRRLHMFEKLGICHEPPATDRVEAAAFADSVAYRTPIFAMAFSTSYALLPRIGWDTLGTGKQTDNLLCGANTQGAFPVVMKGGNRISSESGGGTVEISGRTVRYDDIRIVPELSLSYAYTIKETGFALKIGWSCSESFVTSEFALLRLPFDLYRSVTTILALPDTAGPAGLVKLPLVINSPNYGTMRVTLKETSEGAEAYARVAPFRVHAELWLDLIAGAVPMANGLFEVPQGGGGIELEFELTKIFPLGNRDRSSLFTWWEMPPFYSFADREMILGALPNAWLSGIGYRPDLARFANNSVADSVAISAFYNAEIAAYTPELAPGLSPQELVRVSAEQLLFETEGNVYSNHREFPNAVTSIIDCAWLYVASTGNWDWARRMKNYLLIQANRLCELEDPQTGLAACSFSGVPGDPAPVMTASWSDSVRSGHLESYVNAHAYRAYKRAAELLERLGETERAEQLRDKGARLKANFCRVFYDEESGQIMQWVDANGQKHGFHSRIHLGAAIALDLVPQELAERLLRGFLSRLDASGFDGYDYGLPLYLDPIPAAYHNDWKGKGVEPDGSDQVGVYQNGSYTHHQCYYLLQAMYKTGLRREANELFMKLAPLARRGGLSGGLHSGIDWRKPDGSPSGYEGLLAEQYHFLLAAITGYLGLELTIDGLAFNKAAPESGSDRLARLRPNFARMAGDSAGE